MTPPAPPPSERTRLSDVQLWDERALRRFESSDAAIELQRLAEGRILLLLQLRNFDSGSQEWSELMSALIEYGYAVFTGWGISGLLHRQAAAHRGTSGASNIPEDLLLDPDEAAALAGELMIAVIDTFRSKVLAKGRWDQHGGASLKTYFIGWALMHLPRTYVRWNRLERFGRPATSLDAPKNEALLSSLSAAGTSPARAASVQTELESMLKLIDDPLVIKMFQLQVAGYELEAIAEMLKVTEAVVRTKMSRARDRTRRWRSDHRAS